MTHRSRRMMTRSLVFCAAVLLWCLIAPLAHGQGTASDSTAVFHQDLAITPPLSEP